MPLYVPRPEVRNRQLAADLGMLAWVVLWLLVARTVHRAVTSLDEPGQAVQELGESVAGNMGTAAQAAEGVPIVGDDLAEPLAELAGAADSVTGAGIAAQEAVATLALVLPVVVVVLAVGWMALRWLPWRLRSVREAAAAARLSGDAPDLELLAARALATAPLPRLAALPQGTVAAWRSGDPDAVRALAAVELDRIGLRVPSPSASGARAG